MGNEPKPGDRIRWIRPMWWGTGYEVEEYTLEIYRYTLGFFKDSAHREAGHFTPLCDEDLWTDGPDSKDGYACNHGSYRTNKVQAFEIIRS